MSMLTPPGMGGKYKVKGNAYPRMRRRRKRPVAGVAAAAVGVGVIGWGALQLVDVFQGSDSASAHEKKNCVAARRAAPPAAPLPAPGTITVNVYNATPRTGLAKNAADELKRRGFRIGKIGNASKELDKKIEETALLIGAPGAKQALTVLGAHIAGERTDAADKRTDASVDLVIGNAYTNLGTTQEAQKTLTTRTRTAAPSTPSASEKDC